MKRLIALPVIAIMLPGGCVAGDGAQLNVQHEPVYLDRPVSCVAAKDVPQRPAALGKRPEDLGAAAMLAFAKVLEWESYGDHADPLLQACTKGPAQ